MTTSISSEAFERKTTESQRMKDNTVNKKIISGKTDKVSYLRKTFHKKLRNLFTIILKKPLCLL